LWIQNDYKTSRPVEELLFVKLYLSYLTLILYFDTSETMGNSFYCALNSTLGTYNLCKNGDLELKKKS